MTHTFLLHHALQAFARQVTTKMSQLTIGEPENQLRAPVEQLFTAIADCLALPPIICTGETPLPDRLGRPDYAIHIHNRLIGYVELKAPGTGVSQFKGRNKAQFQRFSNLPNMLYCDGNSWALYRNGKRERQIVHVSGDVASDGEAAVTAQDAQALEALLRDFLAWQPFIATDRHGNIQLKDLAQRLAPLCRLLRDEVADALKSPDSPLNQLAQDWRQLLFPDADNAQFADAYAQTVAFALLLGRSEGAEPLTLDNAEKALVAQHNLLSRALHVLTDPVAQAELGTALSVLLRFVAVVPPETFSRSQQPWLYFYEDFLAAYDAKLRKEAGVYYTPLEVVHCQVRLLDDLLVRHLGKPLGFADAAVTTLDPATGTGTYLLGIIEHALERIRATQGEGAVAGQASTLANNLYGFEFMVGPYAVTELRVSQTLREYGAYLPSGGSHIYLTDTLESPYAEPPQSAFFYRVMAEQHTRALDIKNRIPVIVCLGNPPYKRNNKTTLHNRAQTGGWVRWGDDGEGTNAIFDDFTRAAKAAGHGDELKNIYNHYVYFWRWALWKVFESASHVEQGLISFITPSSYLDGDAFAGMREHLRQHCSSLWILDLGGEGRGTRKDDNVFPTVQSPVAVAIALRDNNTDLDNPAPVYYTRLEGERTAKLAYLDNIQTLQDVDWQLCCADWQAPFRPAFHDAYFDLPLLADLMPWSGRGIQFSRTWVVSEDKNCLEQRWQTLLRAKKTDKKHLICETVDVEIEKTYLSFFNEERLPSIESLTNEQPEKIEHIMYRSFDRQWCIADRRVIDRPRPALWRCRSEQQIYFATLVNDPLTQGPALAVSFTVPDLNMFNNRGGLVYPLYRTADADKANILPGLLDILAATYQTSVTADDFAAYLYATLAHPEFTRHFKRELDTRELRVPITQNAALFKHMRDIGANLLWLHTYGTRWVTKDRPRGLIPSKQARCLKAVQSEHEEYPEQFGYDPATQQLHVGAGIFAPVTPDIYQFEISGLKVLQSWLRYRMKAGAGKKSSKLNDIRPQIWRSQFTTELLELLWVLEATVADYPKQAEVFQAIVQGDCLKRQDLPDVPEYMRSAYKADKNGNLI